MVFDTIMERKVDIMICIQIIIDSGERDILTVNTHARVNTHMCKCVDIKSGENTRSTDKL